MTITVGSRVYLRACRAGEPGVVIKAGSGKFTVYWRDLDYWSRHRPESLELVEVQSTDTQEAA